MTLFKNLVLFTFFFLPLTLVTGLVSNFFVGPLEAPHWGYEVQLYYIHVFKLLVPSIIAVPALHFLYRWRAAAASTNTARALAIFVTPLALLGVHVAIFGGVYWSAPLLALFILPGALYGCLFSIVPTPEAG
jgi:hypothetical protein